MILVGLEISAFHLKLKKTNYDDYVIFGGACTKGAYSFTPGEYDLRASLKKGLYNTLYLYQILPLLFW